MGVFEIKRGSTERVIAPTLTSSNSSDDLSGATSATLYARLKNATINRIDGLAHTSISATTSQVLPQFRLTATHVALAGEYDMYYRVTYSDGRTDRFPSGTDYDTLIIGENFE
jgi:hypothetical protein